MAVYRILENVFSFVFSNLEKTLIPVPYINNSFGDGRAALFSSLIEGLLRMLLTPWGLISAPTDVTIVVNKSQERKFGWAQVEEKKGLIISGDGGATLVCVHPGKWKSSAADRSQSYNKTRAGEAARKVGAMRRQ